MRIVAVAKPDLTERRQKALDGATNAVIGTGINLTLAAFAGLVGGRLHPKAPQVIYSVLATGIGIYSAEHHPQIGSMLTSGGMIAGGSLLMQAIVAQISGQRPEDVPTSPTDVAARVGRTVSASTLTPPPATTPRPTELMAVQVTPTPSDAARG